MTCFKGEGKLIHSSTVQALYARILIRIMVISFVKVRVWMIHFRVNFYKPVWSTSVHEKLMIYKIFERV